MTIKISHYLEYANLQMAAEAFIAPKDSLPETPASGSISAGILTEGNTRASRFTQVQADEFVKDWTVVIILSAAQLNVPLRQKPDDKRPRNHPNHYKKNSCLRLSHKRKRAIPLIKKSPQKECCHDL